MTTDESATPAASQGAAQNLPRRFLPGRAHRKLPLGPVDERQAPKGYKAVHGPDGCAGCAFEHDAACDSSRPCTPGERDDGQMVIFVPADTPTMPPPGEVAAPEPARMVCVRLILKLMAPQGNPDTAQEVLTFLQKALRAPSTPTWLADTQPALVLGTPEKVTADAKVSYADYTDMSMRFSTTQERLLGEIASLRQVNARLVGKLNASIAQAQELLKKLEC